VLFEGFELMDSCTNSIDIERNDFHRVFSVGVWPHTIRPQGRLNEHHINAAW